MRPFEPQPWTAPPAPALAGPFEVNDRLGQARLIPVGDEGPEDVVVDAQGFAYTGTHDGHVLRIDPSGAVSPFAEVGGRPLGLELHGEDLLVCNADLGLQLVSPSGAVKALLDGFDGEKFLLTNNASVASDGTIYFTVSSARWSLEVYVNDLLEGHPTGRAFARAPDGSLRVCVDQLLFANGVALDAAQQSVFVAETGKYRVHRHWLAGPKAGQTERFLDNLPGFPDNLSFDAGVLWVALASPRQKIVDFMGPRGWLRKLSYRLPDALKPAPVRHGIVLGYDESGRLVHNLQASSGKVAITTGARFFDGSLYVGSLSEPHVAVLKL